MGNTLYLWNYNYTKSYEILSNYYNYTGRSVGDEVCVHK